MKKHTNISNVVLPYLAAIVIALITSLNVFAQDGGSRGYQVGCYEGQALNTTFNQKSDVELIIESIDGNGNVKAKFGVKGNGSLVGQGALTGNIDGGGILRLTGPFAPWQIAIAGRADSDTINANYRLTGHDTQDGHFTVTITGDGNCETKTGSDGSSSPRSSQRRPSNNSNYPQFPRNTDTGSTMPNNNQSSRPEIGVGNGDSINGAWEGTYYCPQGTTNLVLSLFTKDGTNVDGIFTFLLGDGASMSVLGSYKMKGTYDSRSASIEMKGVDWDQKPAGFYLVNLSGRVTQPGRRMSGNVTGLAGCTTFQLEKIRFQ